MISNEYGFIFVHVGRTGGSSFERIAGISITSDHRTMHLGNTDFSEKHKSFQYYKTNYPDKFLSYFKFTIVRNPFDRLVSSWIWLTQIVKILPSMSLKEFIESRPTSQTFYDKFKLDGLSIHDSISNFDYIGRFENIQETYNYLCKRFNILNKLVPHTNKTGYGEYQNYYDNCTIDLVNKKYRLDLDLFGYEFNVNKNEWM